MTRASVQKWRELSSDRPMPALSRRRIIADKVMISEVILDKGCFVPMHSHENEQLACIMSGKLRFTISTPSGDETHDVGADEVMVLPAGVPHAAEALERTRVLDVFAPPSASTGIDRH